MATVLGATSATITAILGTIQTTAHTSQRTIATAAAGLDMLDTYVESARHRQAASSKVQSTLFLENLIQESALEQSRLEKSRQQELADPTMNTLFAANYAKLQALFASA